MKQPVNKPASTSSIRWILLIPVVVLLGAMAAVVRRGESAPVTAIAKDKPAKQNTTAGNESGIKKMVRKNIRLYVKAESNDYDRKNLGGIANLEISVNNPTDYALEKVRVKITYIKANGDVFETRYEDFHAVKPNSKATHKIADTKRGTSIKYEIATIKSKALGLS